MRAVVAVGDSIAFGVGDRAVAGDLPGWAGRLGHITAAESVANLGRTGAILAHLEASLPAVLAAEPDVVLVSIGGNDLVQGTFQPGRFRDRLSTILAAFARNGAQVVVVTLPDVSTAVMMPPRLRRSMHARTHVLNDEICAAALATSAVVIDRWSDRLSYAPHYVTVDRVHPSGAGYQHLAAWTAQSLGLEVVRGPLPSDVEDRPRGIWLATSGLAWALRRFPIVLPSIISAWTNGRALQGYVCTGCDPISTAGARGIARQATPAVIASAPARSQAPK